MEILVTGGAGNLGAKVAARLVARGHSVRAMSRRGTAGAPAGGRLVIADLISGAGVAEAVAGVETIVHCASSPFRRAFKTEVEGTALLLERLAREPDPAATHFFYISIVGVDRMPFSYYKAKLAAEAEIETAAVPWTILRATQFHELLDLFVGRLSKLPVVPAPSGFRYQLIDAGEVAEHMVDLVESGAAGRVDDIGGPAVLDVAQIARHWLQARSKRRPVLRVPAFGGFARSMRAGDNLVPHSNFGKRTWEDWLAAKYGAHR